MRAKIPMHDTSSNVFADLGFEDAEALLAKSELVARILKTIRARRPTQAKAAELMGITQPKVSTLLSGRLAGSPRSGCSAS
jgi:predicted XRE-type DNA-binding protein